MCDGILLGRGMRIFLAFLFCICFGLGNSYADVSEYKNKISSLKSQGIENSSNSEILSLYEKLKESVAEYENLEQEFTNALAENARAMKEKEQSTENKILGSTTIAASGIGGMQLAVGLAEQAADNDAEQAMRAYLATFTCKYGDNHVQGGTINVELPGGNDLIGLYDEYVALANSLKERKAALGIKPGVESEINLGGTVRSSMPGKKSAAESAVLSASQSKGQLYDNTNTGTQSNAYTSLSRALSDSNSADAKELATQKQEATDKVKIGASVAGAGAIAGIAGNLIINKDAPKENSEQIKREYNKKQKNLESDIAKAEQDLNKAIQNNEKKINEYNNVLSKHKDFVATMTDVDCSKLQQQYVDDINARQHIDDKFTSMLDIPALSYDLNKEKKEYTDCVELKKAQEECNKKTGYEWTDEGKCVKTKTVLPAQIEPAQIEPDVENQTVIDEEQENEVPATVEPEQAAETVNPEQCPDENPRLRSLNSTYKVGDFCSYGDVAVGEVKKVTSGKNAGTCTCVATECKSGYEVSGGVCKKIIADKEGVCLPAEHDAQNGKNDTDEKCNEFCIKYATDNKCALKEAAFASDKNKCICNPVQQETVATTIQTPEIKYYSVCWDGKGKSGGKEYCIEDPFNWTQVQLLQATALAEEYALAKNKHDIVCDNSYITVGNDDYIKCSSKDGKHFYEFKFHDVAESADADIGHNTRKALCQIIHGGTLQGVKNGYMPCNLDKSKHSALIASAKKFGIETKTINNNSVGLKGNVVKQNYTTKKISGIDSRYFYSEDIQIRANGQMIDGIYSYVAAQLAPREITKFTCDKLPKQQWTIDGKSASGSSDDVLTCYVNNTPIDFVFDDLSEARKRVSNGGYSNMNCSVLGGTYNGHECMNVGELECVRIQKMSADPTVKLAKWNPGTKRCELPAAATATKIQKATKISVMVGGVIFGVVVTVATGGTGAPALALLAVETAGGIAEIGMTVHIDNQIVEFLDNSQKCRDPKCAEQMLKENMQRMSNFSSDMTSAQIHGVDSELARLATIIPKDSDFYITLLEHGTSTSDNAKGFFDWDSWEPEQVWRAVFVAVQLASVVGSVGKWVFGKSKQLVNATKALRSGIGQTADAVGITKKMSRADAKKLLDSYKNGGRAMAKKTAATTKKAAAAADVDLKTNVQNIKRVEKATGVHGDDAVKLAEQTLAIDNATKQLDDAKSALTKRLEWESKQSPAALKNDLQNPNSNGRIVRENVRKMEKQLADLGEEVTPMEFRSVDDILGDVPAPKPVATATDEVADAANGAKKSVDKGDATPVTDATKTGSAPKTLSKAEKIEQARKSGNLGYHGTDADIAMDDMIRSSANTSDQLGGVGYGIAKDYDAAEKYAVKRLIERQNTGNIIDFMLDDGVLVVTPRNPLNLGNKTGYVYTTAKEASVGWTKLRNIYVGAFDAAQMPNSVEVLAKKSFNLDDLIRSGKVRIEEPVMLTRNAVEMHKVGDVAEIVSGNLNVIKRSELSKVDQEFYDLWKAYAPRNQTFDSFKAMSGGDIEQMRQMSKRWVKIDDDAAIKKIIEQQRLDLFDQRPDIMEFYAINGETATVAKYPEYGLASTFQGNYSTYDINLNKSSKGINRVLDDTYDNFNTIFKEATPERRADIKQAYLKTEGQLKDMAVDIVYNTTKLDTLDEVTKIRVQQYMDIIKSDEELSWLLSEFDSLTPEGKQYVGQRILDGFADANNMPRTELEIFSDPTKLGAYSPSTKKIYVKPNDDVSDFINTLAHEQAHMVDDINPNMGALGAQRAHISERIYTTGKNYGKTLQEQSSWPIGDAVQEAVKSVLQ